jgi:hypothetical protein
MGDTVPPFSSGAPEKPSVLIVGGLGTQLAALQRSFSTPPETHGAA